MLQITDEPGDFAVSGEWGNVYLLGWFNSADGYVNGVLATQVTLKGFILFSYYMLKLHVNILSLLEEHAI